MASQNIDIIIQAKDLASKSLNGARKSLKGLKVDTEAIKNAWSSISTSGSIAFGAIAVGINSVTKSSNEARAAMVGLQSIVEGVGENFDQAKKTIEDFTADGLVAPAEAATALKNLLARGFGLQEATDMMNRFKDSAAFGRQSSLSLGEAVKSASEGIKNENSILVDNAGVTKNVSVMWEEYADKLGKGVNELTIAEKRQAEYNGIMNETRFQVGDAAKLSKEFAGTQAVLGAETNKLKVQIGEALTPVLKSLYDQVIPIIQKTTEWVKNNSELTAKLILVAGAVTGVIAAMTAIGFIIGPLTSAFILVTGAVQALGGALMFLAANPIGLVIVAIGSLIAAGVLLYKNWDTVKLNVGGALFFMLEDMKSKIQSMKDFWFGYGVYLHQQFLQIKENLVSVGAGIYEGFIGWIDAMSNAITEKVTAVMNFVKNKVDAAKQMLASIGSKISNTVQNTVQTVQQTVSGTRANGGPVSQNKSYLVGERGPELFVPNTPGKIVPNTSTSGGITINMGGVVVQNEADEDRLIQKMTRMIQLQKLGIS